MYMRKYFWLNYLSFIGLFCMLLMGVFVNVIGLKWGLPQPARYDLVLPDALQTTETYHTMAEEHADLFSDSNSIVMTKSVREATISDFEKTDQHIIVNTPRNYSLFRSIERSYLIRTFEPDLTNIMNGFSRINPARFDFFPDTFFYGIFYFIITGVFLKIFELFRLIVVENSILYYIQNIRELAKIYLSLRVINLIYSVVTSIVIYKISRLYVSRKLSLFNLFLYLLVPTTVIANYVVKPHTLGVLFCMLMIYYCIRILKGEEKIRLMICAGIFAACAYGSVISNGIYVLALGVTYLVLLKRNNLFLFSQKSIAIFLAIFIPYGLIVLLSSVYIFADPQTFISETHFTSNFVATKSMMAGLKQIVLFFPSVTPYIGFPMVVIGCFGLLMWRKVWSLILCLFVIFIILFLPKQVGFRIRFFLPVIPLVIIGASSVIDSLFRSHFFKSAVVLLVIISIIPIGSGIAEAKHFWYDTGHYATRVQAATWINENIPPASSIGIGRIPSSFFCPPFQFSRYTLVIPPFSDRVDSVRPEYIVVSYNANEDTSKLQHAGYRKIVEFKNEVAINKIIFFKKHYYTSANPKITIYKR